MQQSYYDVLGVSPSADDREIRARYHRLIRRHHPDRNRSPLAHARAAQINEAFRFLSDPELRAWHDAQLAARRQDVVSARAVGQALALRRRSPFRRYGAQLLLLLLLALTAAAGWRIERHLAGAPDALAALASDPDPDGTTESAVAALKAASAEEAQQMPPVSAAAVAEGVGAYRRIAAGGGATGALAFSDRCHARAADAGGWDALDFCVAFDQAAFMAGGGGGGAFADRHDRAAHYYVARLSSLDAIELRLARIRGRVATLFTPPPASSAGVLHRLNKRGWKLADAAWHVLDPSPLQTPAPAAPGADF